MGKLAIQIKINFKKIKNFKQYKCNTIQANLNVFSAKKEVLNEK